jgi:hypothetical protein
MMPGMDDRPGEGDELCRRPAGPGETVGAPCPICWHTNLVHQTPGGLPQPCGVCELQAATRRAEALIERLGAAVGS